MGNYVTAAEVQAEGATASEARINNRISKWETLVEQMTGNVFYEISPGEIAFDGSNSPILHFNLPIISCSSVKINDETVALAAIDYEVFSGRQVPKDDRRNPKIVLTPSGQGTIYRSNPSTFIKGYKQRITATWGFVEPGTGKATPAPIKAAIISLVCLDLDNYFDTATSNSAKDIQSETTDGHSITYSSGAAVSYWASIPPDIAEILSLYRRPWIITTAEQTPTITDPTLAIVGW